MICLFSVEDALGLSEAALYPSANPITVQQHALSEWLQFKSYFCIVLELTNL